MPAGLSPSLTLLVITAATFTLLLSGRVRPDLVALFVPIALGATHLLTPTQALSGFSNTAVLTIAGLFVISAALERTGVVRWLADRLAGLSGASEPRMVAVFTAAGALLSLVMNNIAAGAVLLPAAVQVARRAGVSPARVLMPLAFGTLLGGMATLFTTANIIVSGSLQAQGQRALTMSDFLPAGGLTVLAGLGYLLLLGRRWLPRRESVARTALPRPDLLDTYQLAERLWEVRVLPGSPLVGQTLSASLIGSQLGVAVMAIWRGRTARIAPAPDEQIAADDLLLVLGREERVSQLTALGARLGRNGHGPQALRTLAVHLCEVLIGPRASAIGQTLKSLRLRSRFGVTAVALWREGRSYRTDVGDFVLEPGDALLVVGGPEALRNLAAEPGLITPDQPQEPPPPPERARWAIGITLAALLLSATRALPTAEVLLASSALLVQTGCLSMEDAYRAIEWRVVVLIAGLLPIGTALTESGLAAQIGQALTGSLASAGPLALLAALYLLTVALTQVAGGQVAALLVGPVAVSAAVQLQVNPQAVGVAVAMACSAAFLTPVAHPVNLLMLGPGGYTFGDFLRVGSGLALVCFLTLLAAMPLLWPL